MNIISYRLLQSDRATEAADVLKLGIEAYPNAFNLYDSYGEVLTTLGNKEEAIENYKKSLALNPKNENGIKMLKKLGINIDETNLYLLKTESNWTQEVFTFPLDFAKEINYEGTEEAHFPKGWRDLESSEFWSYAFAWNINLSKKLTATELETDLQFYFDGLMKVVNKEKDRVLPKAIAKIHQKEKGTYKFTGTIKTFDAFVTKKPMTLNVLVEQHSCEEKKNSIIVFKFSPKAFGNEIWQTLEKIKLGDNVCKN